MINTSAAYQAAIVGSPRRIELLAVVDISDPDMEYGTVTMDSQAPWSKPGELHDKVLDAPARYATLEPGRWPLDGSCLIFPDDFQVQEHMGVCGDLLCDEDGYFPAGSPAFVQQDIANVDVLQAFSLFFSSDPVDGVPMDFIVEVLQGSTAYFSREVTGNTAAQMAFDGFTVHNPTAIRLTATRWSLPRRRMRVTEIIPGIYEQWSNRLLASFSCTMSGDFSCLSLPYGTVDITLDNRSRRFEPRKKDSLFSSIEARQGIEIYLSVRLATGAYERVKLGTYYQAGDGWKTSTNDPTIGWSLVDIVGLVCDRTYLPPDTLPTTLEGWIASVVDQLGENFAGRYTVDPDYAGLVVTANSREEVTGKRCGDIIRWACMATGTWPRADQETGYLAAEPLWNQGNKMTLDNLVSYPTMRSNKNIAALIFTLADANKTQYVVSGPQTASEDTVSVQNPFIHTQEQALTAARLILSCYGGNLYETTGRGDPSSEVGDVDIMWLDESTAATARRTMQSFAFNGGVLQGAQTKAIQADGSYLFEECAVLTQSGTWTAPAGVNQLRLILVGKGSDGQDGEDGTWDGTGEAGADGPGGLVWAGTVSINPQQQFVVGIGEHTVFGDYSSANGARYANGYTDVASGSVYGRSGVQSPAAGTGDGGKGGRGGTQGVRYERTYRDESGATHWETVTVSSPGDGESGVSGATGCVVIWWEKVKT